MEPQIRSLIAKFYSSDRCLQEVVAQERAQSGPSAVESLIR